MGKGIAGLEAAYRGLFTTVLIILAVLVILCLVRAIIGPRIADRIVSVNMMGTMVIVIIGILTVMLGEGYLADICIIYAMISFLAVIVLTKVYMGVYLEKKETEERRESEEKEESQMERDILEEEEIRELNRSGNRKEEKIRELERPGNRKEDRKKGKSRKKAGFNMSGDGGTT